jgi:hypothetical protein
LRREVSAVFPSLFFPLHGPLAAGMYIIASTFSVILIINLVEREWGGLRSPELASDQRYFGSQEFDSECVSATQIAASMLLEFPSNFVSG